MPTFRRKSTSVDARHLTADTRDGIVEWIRGHGVMVLEEDGGALVILTRSSTARAVADSWVIHDDVCGFAVCDADAFDARFYDAGGA